MEVGTHSPWVSRLATAPGSVPGPAGTNLLVVDRKEQLTLGTVHSFQTLLKDSMGQMNVRDSMPGSAGPASVGYGNAVFFSRCQALPQGRWQHAVGFYMQ